MKTNGFKDAHNNIRTANTNSRPEILWQSRLANPPQKNSHAKHKHFHTHASADSRPFFCKPRFKCYNCGKDGHKAAQCRTNPRRWDAKRIVVNKIKTYNSDNGRAYDHKRGFQTVLFEIAEERNELCSADDAVDDNIRIMFGDLLRNDADTQPPAPVDDSQTSHELVSTVDGDPTSKEVFQSMMTEADGNHVENITSQQESLDIFFVTQTLSIYTISTRKQTGFAGACIDTGAARNVIGESQAIVYCREFNNTYSLRPNS